MKQKLACLGYKSSQGDLVLSDFGTDGFDKLIASHFAVQKTLSVMHEVQKKLRLEIDVLKKQDEMKLKAIDGLAGSISKRLEALEEENRMLREMLER